MNVLLYCNQTDGTVSDSLDGATTFTFPTLSPSDRIKFALRFSEIQNGAKVEVDRTVAALRAALGPVDARPESGEWQLQIGPGVSTEGNTTQVLSHDCLPGTLETAIAALTEAVAEYGAPVVEQRDGSWFLKLGDGAEDVPMEIRGNRLWPLSSLEVRAQEIDGEIWHELRLVRAPVAQTSGWLRNVPEEPSITTITNGGADAGVTWNEIQSLYIPPSFRGIYRLKRGEARSGLLSRDDGIEQIAEALKPLADEGGRWEVTNPIPWTAYIEFAGEMGGLDHAPLEVEVFAAPEGDIELSLELSTPGVWDLLRRVDTVTLPLEIVAEFVNAPGGTILRADVTLQRPVGRDSLIDVIPITWALPMGRKDYVPFTMDQVLTGQQQAFTSVIGNGVATTFTITHNLGSEVCSVCVRENISSGRLLQPDEYEVRIENENVVTVSFPSAPPEGSLALWVVGIGPASVFQSHTHTTAQIENLDEVLSQMSTRMVALETKFTDVGVPATANSGGGGMDILLPETADILFLRSPAGSKLEAKDLFDKEKGIDVSKLPKRTPYLLPAVHDASPETLPTTVPENVGALVGRVYENEGSEEVLIPGGGGIPSSRIAPEGFAACDGRLIYGVNQWPGTNSYYPSACERVLFSLAVNDKQFAARRTLEILWGVQLQMLMGNTKGQWVLSVELGEIESEQTTPVPTLGLNLERVVWGPPVFEQPLVITPLMQSHFFGIRIARTITEIKLDQNIYGVWSANNSAAPAEANFAVRARLTRFDCENIDNPAGWVGWRLIGSMQADGEGKPKIEPAHVRIY